MSSLKIPKRRFAEFKNDGEWEEKRLNEFSLYYSSNLSTADIEKDGTFDLYDANGVIGKTNINLMRNDYISIIKDGAGVGRVRILPAYSSFIGTMGAIIPKYSDLNYLVNILDITNFQKETSGGTIPHIYYSQYSKKKYTIPTLPEQTKIGDFFNNLDSLINLQKDKVEKAKALKKSYLTEMFPTQGQTKPKRRFAGFTDDWQEISFNDIADYKKGPFGSALTKEIFVPKSNNSVKIYEQQNAIKKDFKLERYFIQEEYAEKLKSFQVNPGDIIVSCAGTIGEIYILPEDSEKGIINQALMRIRVNKTKIEINLFIILFSNMIDDFTKTHSNGSAIKNIPPFADLKEAKIFIPTLEEQRKLVNFISTLDNQISIEQKKLEKLQDIKKAYLSEMFV